MEKPESASDQPKTQKEVYIEYLKSSHWRGLRKDLFKRVGCKCEACGHGGVIWPIDAHHLIYRTPLESCTSLDLMALCRRCHDIVHDTGLPYSIPQSASLDVRRSETLKRIAENIELPPAAKPKPQQPQKPKKKHLWRGKKKRGQVSMTQRAQWDRWNEMGRKRQRRQARKEARRRQRGY